MNEEQLAEQEALASIYGSEGEFVAEGDRLTVKVFPQQEAASAVNHVGVRLEVTLLADYPAMAPPGIAVTSLKGLEAKQVAAVQALAEAAAIESLGMPSVYTVVERIREWLVENNTAANEGSAYDEMLRRDAERARAADAASGIGGASSSASGRVGTAYSKDADPSLAATRGGTRAALSASAAEEDEAARRRKEGTPVTVATFLAWRERFEREAAAKAAAAAAAAAPVLSKAGAAAAEAASVLAAARQTGKTLFETGFASATADDTAPAVGGDDVGVAAAAAGAGSAGSAAMGAPISFHIDAALYGDGDVPDDADGDEEAGTDDDDDEEWTPGDGEEDEDGDEEA